MLGAGALAEDDCDSEVGLARGVAVREQDSVGGAGHDRVLEELDEAGEFGIWLGPKLCTGASGDPNVLGRVSEPGSDARDSGIRGECLRDGVECFALLPEERTGLVLLRPKLDA